MPGGVLTTASTILCPHGGIAVLTTANARVTAGGAPVLLESDIHTVAGCPFVIALKPSPCIRIQWAAGAARAQAGAPVLAQSSIGICFSPESAPQGVAIVVNTQPKVSAQ
jgi:hypothetical protein